jgi:DNA repair exonuclease SbcCD ATPase subunit
MNITVSKLATGGYGVVFPIVLKDNFKAHFKSARWNRDCRRWEVGVRSKAKLDQWIDEVQGSGVIEAAEAAEAAEMAEDDLRELRRQIAALKDQAEERTARLAKLRETKEGREKLLAELATAKAELERASAEVQAEADKVKAREAEIDEILSTVIDMNDMRQAAGEMARAIGSDRAVFNRAMRRVDAAREDLAKAGYELTALEILSSANYNRPDRDDPKRMSDEAWYRLSRIEE